jgi:hypothetical protein
MGNSVEHTHGHRKEVVPGLFCYRCVRPLSLENGRYAQCATILPASCDLFQNTARHAERKFVLAQKYRPRILVPQQHRLFFTMGTHQSLDVRVKHARDFYHSTRTKGIGGRNHQYLRPRNMRINKDSRVRGIARDGTEAAFAQRLDQLTILLRHDEWQSVFGERLTNAPTHTAIADEHHMARNLARLNRHRQFRQGIVGALQGKRELRA